MKIKLLNLLLITTPLVGYLEWGGGSHAFLFQAEADIIYKIFTSPASILHPFILLPLLGQVLLFITLFQKIPSNVLTYAGILNLGLLLGFIFIVGILGLNYKVTISTVPFIAVAIFSIINIKKPKQVNNMQ